MCQSLRRIHETCRKSDNQMGKLEFINCVSFHQSLIKCVAYGILKRAMCRWQSWTGQSKLSVKSRTTKCHLLVSQLKLYIVNVRWDSVSPFDWRQSFVKLTRNFTSSSVNIGIWSIFRHMEGHRLFSTTRMTVVMHREHFHNPRPVGFWNENAVEETDGLCILTTQLPQINKVVRLELSNK